MIPVVFDPDAQAEFLEAVRYYEDCQTGLGRRFKFSVEEAVQSIAKTPFRYRVLHAPFRRYLLPKFPYSIIYCIGPENILIIAVAHTKRKPGYWIQRG